MGQPTLFGWADLGDADVPAGATLADARPYQHDMTTSVFASWRGHQRCLGIAATGVGKTFVFGLIGRKVLDGELDPVCTNKRGILIIAHRIDLVEQTATEVGRLLHGVDVEIEQGESHAFGDAPVVAACADSLTDRRLDLMGIDRFQCVLWDECHRFGKTGVRKRVMERFGDSVRHFGTTATPRDGVASFGRPAFDYGVWRAVEDGYLVKPYLAYEITSDVSVEGVPLTKSGDFDGEALGRRMSEARPVAAVVAAAVKWSNYANGHGSARPTVVCCSSVNHAKIVALQLNERHATEGTGRAAAIYGDQDPGDRVAAMDAFRRGAIRYLSHYDCLTEGFDHDEVRVLVNGRPTRSQWVFSQNAGRPLRPLRTVARLLGGLPDAKSRRDLIAGSAKPGAMIVDVAGVDHKLTVDLASVFHAPGDEELVEAVRHRARERNGKPVDPTLDFEELRRKRDEALVARWKGIRTDATFTTRMADPFDVLAVVTGREPRWAKGKKPTDPMLNVLLGAGIPRTEVDRMSFVRAKALVDVVFKRRDSGLCTYKQARLLKGYGYDGACMTFEEAKSMIDRIARDGWRQP